VSDIFLAPRDLNVTVIDDNYTLALTDAGKAVDVDGATDTVLVTIPDNATVPFPTGAVVEIANLTVEDVTIDGDNGVTVRSFDEDDLENGATGARTMAGRYAVAVVRKLDTDEWLLTGQLEGIA
jgi:hypothetical protein